MTRILRESAELREQLERARSTEDRGLAADEAAACLKLIAASDRPLADADPSR